LPKISDDYRNSPAGQDGLLLTLMRTQLEQDRLHRDIPYPRAYDDISSQKEADLIREFGGFVVRVINNRVPDDGNAHKTAQARKNLACDMIVYNNGTLEELEDTAKRMNADIEEEMRERNLLCACSKGDILSSAEEEKEPDYDEW
jgi:hypothetical protein